MKSTNYPAALVLFFLPAISVELLTGDTPLPEYLQPLTFVVLNLTYGATLLVIRETVVRWHQGFPSILVLAAGYGMLNEGIDTKGMFAPHFYAVVGSGLEGFGRAFGINVPWALDISIFHAVFSMIVPLTIVSAMFRDPGRWVGDRVYAALIVGIVACSLFCFRVLSLGPDYFHYNEGPGPLFVIVALMAALIVLAWRLPAPPPRRLLGRMPSLAWFPVGFALTIAFVTVPPHLRAATGSVAGYLTLLLVAFVAVPIWLGSALPEPSTRGKLALVTGLLGPVSLSGIHGQGSQFATVVLAALIAIAFRQNRQPTLPAVAVLS